MIKVHVIASGSKGNASIIYNEKTTILVDFGVSIQRLTQGLKEINKAIEDIDFALFTHDHKDHILNHTAIDENKRYAREKTIPLLKENILELNKKYQLGTFEIEPLEVSHDAFAPCGFLFKCEDEELVYITDTGVLPLKTVNKIKNKDYYYFESNYDTMLLLKSNRPHALKERILSNYGHLSNEMSSFYLASLIGDKTKGIIFAHVSEDCNTYNLPLLEAYHAFLKAGYTEEKIPKLVVAKQHESVDL